MLSGTFAPRFCAGRAASLTHSLADVTSTDNNGGRVSDRKGSVCYGSTEGSSAHILHARIMLRLLLLRFQLSRW